ncbi:hypothetical protein GCM10010517_70350 [Streptosporangium fragile]|uniref:Uncharacterized protein n=1 Tax=Streptosporangium fragile TaxID=46186 RepID=A0ABN3W820_9ACTN
MTRVTVGVRALPGLAGVPADDDTGDACDAGHVGDGLISPDRGRRWDMSRFTVRGSDFTGHVVAHHLFPREEQRTR